MEQTDSKFFQFMHSVLPGLNQIEMFDDFKRKDTRLTFRFDDTTLICRYIDLRQPPSWWELALSVDKEYWTGEY